MRAPVATLRRVPLDFLTDAQVARYGRFDGMSSRQEMERFFFLDDLDRRLAADRRFDHSRLGFVLQATTVRYVGLVLEDPLDVPWPVVEYRGPRLAESRVRLTCIPASNPVDRDGE